MIDEHLQGMLFADVLCHLPAPIGHHTDWSHNQCRLATIALERICDHQRNHFQRLSQAHVVAQNASTGQFRLALYGVVGGNIDIDTLGSWMRLPELDCLIRAFGEFFGFSFSSNHARA